MTTTKIARLMGCVAAAWLFGAGVGNAATITLGPFSGAGLTATQDDAQNIGGNVTSLSALAYLSDWIEFSIAPSTLSAVNVNVLNRPFTSTPSFPNEFFQITVGSTSGAVVFGPTAASGVPSVVSLSTGLNYFLELTSDAPPGVGRSDFAVAVPEGRDTTTPIPGALLLFGTVLGAGGLLMRRRRDGGDLAAAA
jgi:hypothetical protein